MFEPTDEQRSNVRALVLCGVRQEVICRVILNPNGKPICDKTLRRHFREELDMAMDEANAEVAATALSMAKSGQHPEMTKFWLQTRCGWKPASVQQTQLLSSNGRHIDPPTFGISFARGGPGHG